MNPLKIAFAVGGIAALLVPKSDEKPHTFSVVSGVAIALLAGFIMAQDAK